MSPSSALKFMMTFYCALAGVSCGRGWAGKALAGLRCFLASQRPRERVVQDTRINLLDEHPENHKNVARVPKVALFCFSNISTTLSLHFSASA